METALLGENMNNDEKFKSHYVVWKLLFSNTTEIARTWFKSHYVVWKLLFSNTTEIARTWFKSHYVVWKLIFSGTSEIGRTSRLNRTM